MKKLLLFSALMLGNSYANPLYFDIVVLDNQSHSLTEKLEENCQSENGCLDIQIQYLNTNNQAINHTINQKIAENFDTIIPQNISVPSQSEHNKIIEKISEKRYEALQEGDDSYLHEFTVDVEYLGHHQQFELFAINHTQFTGGAHGLAGSQYYMLTTDGKKISLDDLLVDETKKSLLEKLAQQAYDKSLKESDIDAEEHFQTFPFSLTDNVMFTQFGLKFRYQPYEIAPYAHGMPEFVVPYQELEGLIKSEYLQH